MPIRPLPILGILAACLVLPASGPAQEADPATTPGGQQASAADLTVIEAAARGTSSEQPAEPVDNQAEQRVRAEPWVDTTDPLAEVAAAPLRKTSPEIEPYEALGIRAGSFILYPSIETAVGYTTNAQGVAGGRDSAFVTVTPEMRAVSDWARHEATISMRGTYEDYFEDPDADDPTADIEATLKLEHNEEWTTDLAAAYHYRRQDLSDPNTPGGLDEGPPVHEFVTSADMRGRFGRSVVEWGTHVTRTVYEDGTSGGVPLDQSDRDETEIGGRLRYGFAVTDVTTPFIEARLAREQYDQTVDNNGFERSAWIYGLRGGIAYQAWPVLTAELAVGYARAEPDDDALSSLETLTFDGWLTWMPTELTTVRFNAYTDFSPTSDPASSGSVAHDASVDLDYEWRENVTLGALAGVNYERFIGTDVKETTVRAGVDATWKLNRNLWLIGGYLHEWFDSSEPDADYNSDEVRLTLRLQQ
jgi:hypothetical protein